MNDADLLEAKYTAPSGGEFVFLWEKLSKKTELKTGVFTFPDIDGAHVQHQGAGAVSYPMECVFWGPDHIKNSGAFEAALFERGVGELQHPIYGIKKVTPAGSVSRDNDFLGGVNESRVTVTFTETIEGARAEVSSPDALAAAYEDFYDAACADFASNIGCSNIGEKLNIQSALLAQAGLIEGGFAGMAGRDHEFQSQLAEFKSSVRSMFDGAEAAAQAYLNTARAALNAVKAPGLKAIGISEKIRGYTLLITQIQDQFRRDPLGLANIRNSFAAARLVLSGALASLSLAAAFGAGDGRSDSGGRMSRESVLGAAQVIKTLRLSIQSFEDGKAQKNSFIDFNAAGAHLLNVVVNDSLNIMREGALSLPVKKIKRLTEDRNMIELCAELYGGADAAYLDELITENNLSADDMAMIPMGREVAYYG